MEHLSSAFDPRFRRIFLTVVWLQIHDMEVGTRLVDMEKRGWRIEDGTASHFAYPHVDMHLGVKLYRQDVGATCHSHTMYRLFCLLSPLKESAALDAMSGK